MIRAFKLNRTSVGTALLAVAMMAMSGHAQTSDTAADAPYTTVSSKAFADARAGTILIDVREKREWDQSGMPAGAKGISISRPDFVEAVLATMSGDKDQPVAVICRSGARSKRAADQLIAAGFTNVTNVGDGMIGRDGVGEGWLASNLEVVESPVAGE